MDRGDDLAAGRPDQRPWKLRGFNDLQVHKGGDASHSKAIKSNEKELDTIWPRCGIHRFPQYKPGRRLGVRPLRSVRRGRIDGAEFVKNRDDAVGVTFGDGHVGVASRRAVASPAGQRPVSAPRVLRRPK